MQGLVARRWGDRKRKLVNKLHSDPNLSVFHILKKEAS